LVLVYSPSVDTWCSSASLCSWKRHLMPSWALGHLMPSWAKQSTCHGGPAWQKTANRTILCVVVARQTQYKREIALLCNMHFYVWTY